MTTLQDQFLSASLLSSSLNFLKCKPCPTVFSKPASSLCNALQHRNGCLKVFSSSAVLRPNPLGVAARGACEAPYHQLPSPWSTDGSCTTTDFGVSDFPSRPCTLLRSQSAGTVSKSLHSQRLLPHDLCTCCVLCRDALVSHLTIPDSPACSIESCFRPQPPQHVWQKLCGL